jgi:hypothetical protein
MEKGTSVRDYDWWLLATALAICGVGVIEIWSATHASRLAGMHVHRQEVFRWKAGLLKFPTALQGAHGHDALHRARTMTIFGSAQESIQHSVSNLKLLVFLEMSAVLFQERVQQKSSADQVKIVFDQVWITVRPTHVYERPQATDEVWLLGRAVAVGQNFRKLRERGTCSAGEHVDATASRVRPALVRKLPVLNRRKKMA